MGVVEHAPAEPGRRTPLESDVCQAGAAIERIPVNKCYAVGYGDTSQCGTARERMPTNVRYAVGYGDTRQACAA